ncbi:Bor family protein [Winslowiella toletana]|nr:Bor family protein [Winslowiella toletana]
MKKFLATAVFALLLTGCAQQSFVLKQNQTSAPKQVTTHHFFVSGIGQKKTLDAAAICGGQDKVARVETQQTFVNGLLGVVTFGIYTPREARVYCSL